MRTKKRVSLALIITMLTLFCFMGSILSPYAHAEEFLDDSVPTSESQTTVEKEEKSFWDSFLGFLGVDSTPKINFQLEVANMSDYSGEDVLVKPGDQITVTAYLEDYRDATEEVGSLSVEFPKGNKGKYTVAENPTNYVDGSQIETTSGGNYIFVYCPIPEEDTITTSEVSTETDPCPVIPKGTEKDTRLFSFTVQIATTEITAGDEFSLELSEIVLGDADDNFITNGDGVEYNSGTEAKKTVNFKVTNDVPVQRIELNNTTVYPIVGGKARAVGVKFIPENATNKNITWTSDNDSIATVTNGNVTGVSYGKTTITAVTEDGNKKAECTADVSFAGFVTVSVNAGESLALRFYTTINFPENFNPDHIKMKCWRKDDPENCVLVDGNIENSYYIYEYGNIAARQMGDKICAQFVLYNTKTKSFDTTMGKTIEYSVQDYCEYMLGLDSTKTGLKDLLVAILNYGASAQKNFQYKTNALVNTALSAEKQIVPSVESSYLANYMHSTTPCPNEMLIKFNSPSLSVENKVHLRFYFQPATGKTMTQEQVQALNFYYKSDVAESSFQTAPITYQGDNVYYVSIGISSSNLVNMYECYIADNQGNQVSKGIKFGAFSYCKLIIETDDLAYSSDLKQLCNAIIDYGNKANLFFK